MVRNIFDIREIEQLKMSDFELVQNPYFVIDLFNFDFDSSNIELYVYENDVTYAYLLRYYNTIQVYEVRETDDWNEIIDWINDRSFSMITCSKKVSIRLKNKLLKYKSVDGSILSTEYIISHAEDDSILAVANDCIDIAKLICSDKSIGSHYNEMELSNQLKYRMLNDGCRNVVIKNDNNHIVSHMGTYAENSDYAILGGLITNPEYRNQGLGSRVLKTLTFYVQRDKKIPILYCFDEERVDWYRKKKWNIVGSCTKFEL